MSLPAMSSMVRFTRATARAKMPVSKNVKRYVKKAVNRVREVEETIVTNASENASFDQTGFSAFDLTSSAITDAGDKLEILSIKGRILLNNPASAGTVFVRVVILQWYKDNECEAPTKSLVLSTTNTAVDVYRPFNQDAIDNSSRFKVLSDKTYKLGEATSVEGNEKKIIPYLITQKRLGRKYIKANSSSGGFNNVYMLAWSDVAEASTPPTIGQVSVLRFRDEA